MPNDKPQATNRLMMSIPCCQKVGLSTPYKTISLMARANGVRLFIDRMVGRVADMEKVSIRERQF
jgi:hypothetical protein